MKLDSSDLKGRYREMRDEEFALIKREHLTEEAKLYFDEELQRRSPADYRAQEEARAKELATPSPAPKEHEPRGWVLLLQIVFVILAVVLLLFRLSKGLHAGLLPALIGPLVGSIGISLWRRKQRQNSSPNMTRDNSRHEKKNKGEKGNTH